MKSDAAALAPTPALKRAAVLAARGITAANKSHSRCGVLLSMTRRTKEGLDPGDQKRAKCDNDRDRVARTWASGKLVVRYERRARAVSKWIKLTDKQRSVCLRCEAQVADVVYGIKFNLH